MALRDHQSEIAKQIEQKWIKPNKNKLLIEMPTGTGKTMMASYVASKYPKGKILWIAHETSLVKQLSIEVPKCFKLLNIKYHDNIKFTTRQGLALNLQESDIYDLLICDEIHAGTAGKDSDHTEYTKILKSKIYSNLLMLSATPWDLDHKLITKYDIENNRISFKMNEAIVRGIMHPVEFKRIDTGIQSVLRNIKTNVTEEVYENDIDSARARYSDLEVEGLDESARIKFKNAHVSAVLDVYLSEENINDTKTLPPTIIYCNSVSDGVDSIDNVFNILKKRLARIGIGSNQIGLVHGNTKDKTDVIKNFKGPMGSDKINILIVCDMLRAGFDYQGLECIVDFGLNVVNARDTIQKLGRLTRTKTGKETARYYYSRSLYKYIPIMGVRRELTPEFIGKIGDMTDRLGEVRAGAIMDIGAIQYNSGQINSDDKAFFVVGNTHTVSDSVDKEVLELFKKCKIDKSAGRLQSVVSTVGFIVDRVEDVGKINYSFKMNECFKVVAGSRDPDGKWEALLAWDDEKRPNKHADGIEGQLGNFIGTLKKYNPEKYELLRNKLKPLWFIDTAQENKNKLIEMARNGEARPNQSSKDLVEKRLARSLSSYTSQSHSCFDKKFNQLIRKLRPDWFPEIKKPISSKETFIEIKQFYKDHKRLPTHGSKNPKEANLAKRCNTAYKNNFNIKDWCNKKRTIFIPLKSLKNFKKFEKFLIKNHRLPKQQNSKEKNLYHFYYFTRRKDNSLISKEIDKLIKKHVRL